VIVNESYEDFATKLQTEIEDETDTVFANRVKNKREQRLVRVKKEYSLDENFKVLWNRIKHKTRYSVTFDSEELINKVADTLSGISISKPRISSRRASIEISREGVRGIEKSNRSIDASVTETVPDVLSMLQARTKLTRKTIFLILEQAGKIEEILTNPQQVVDEATRAIEQVLTGFMVDGIKYERQNGEEWAVTLFDNEEILSYLFDKGTGKGAKPINDQRKTLYDHVVVESRLESEFAEELENREEVKFYFKLPGWFKIATPLGSYNPDWALIFENDKRIYFVAETKGTDSEIDLRVSENLKIKCGKKHFSALDGLEFRGPIRVVYDLIR